jgi:hypothetical protein
MKFCDIQPENITANEYKKNLLIKYGDDKDFLQVQIQISCKLQIKISYFFELAPNLDFDAKSRSR